MSAAAQTAIARATLKAFEPLLDLCLDMGISSPELESLVRAVFVHRAKTRLSKQAGDGRAASDVRVALATGVHRNFVRQILAQAPQISPERAGRRHRASRLLRAWHSERRYLDNAWHPRELPVRAPGRQPSFSDLVKRHMPGMTAGVVLEELRRAGVVQLLADDRIRVRSRSFRAAGVNAISVGEAAVRTRELLETLFFNMRKPEVPRVCEDMTVIAVDRGRMAATLHVINKRVKIFIDALEHELEGAASASSVDRVDLGLTVYSWERAESGD